MVVFCIFVGLWKNVMNLSIILHLIEKFTKSREWNVICTYLGIGSVNSDLVCESVCYVEEYFVASVKIVYGLPS